jgi:hypothetical protein
MLRTGRKAASVLPVAVGEIKRTFLPSSILGIVFSWGSVGLRSLFAQLAFALALQAFQKRSQKLACNTK